MYSYMSLGITQGISDGFTLIVPDYQGFKSAFAAGRLEGHGVLDSARAALNFPGAKLSKTAKIAVIGVFVDWISNHPEIDINHRLLWWRHCYVSFPF